MRTIALLLLCCSSPIHARRLQPEARSHSMVESKHLNDGKSSTPYVTIPPLSSAKDACPRMAAGTLIVGCMGADDLRKAETFSNSDPYCRINIVDTRDLESRHLFGKKKFQIVSETMISSTKWNKNSPEWKEAFEIDVKCPHVPESYDLEVNVMQDFKMIKNSSLGQVQLPLYELIHGSHEGEQSFELEGSKDKAQGSFKLFFQWCSVDHQYDKCKEEALAAVGGDKEVKGTTGIQDCEQSCHSFIAEPLKEVTKAIKGTISSIKGNARMEAIADAMEDFHEAMEEHHDEEGDRAEFWGNRSAEYHHDRLEDHHEDQADAWDDIGDHFEDKVKGAWKNLRKTVDSLNSHLQEVGNKMCGHTLSRALQQMGIDLTPASKFSFGAADSLKRQLNWADKQIDVVADFLQKQWENGNTLPLSQEVPPRCAQHFGA